METAVTKLGASVVSMSFGATLEYFGFGDLRGADRPDLLRAALAANPNVTFLASTGDSGAAPGFAPNYPSLSPNVVAVGGTTLNLDKTGKWQSETGWSDGGGGISTFYSEPVFQQNDGFNSGGFRTVPDVSADADPNTGVLVYDPSDFGDGNFVIVGGTSLSSPLWAGLIAIADQGRVLNGLAPLGGPTQTLPALYSIPASDYHDITVGNNFFNALPGYDLITGRGSPIASKLIPDLVDFGAATSAVIAYQPPTNVVQGGVFGTVVEAAERPRQDRVRVHGDRHDFAALRACGRELQPDHRYDDERRGRDRRAHVKSDLGDTLCLHDRHRRRQEPVCDIDHRSGRCLDRGDAGRRCLLPACPSTSAFATISALAGSNAQPTDKLMLVYDADYQISQRKSHFRTLSSMANKTIQILGQGAGKSVITANGSSRDFEILGLNAQKFNNLTVFFQGLTISGGRATDTGGLVLPTGSGIGGGVLMDGGLVTMSQVTFQSNSGRRRDRQHRALSVHRSPVVPADRAGPAASARGARSIWPPERSTLKNDVITGNIAQGGFGGVGGTGGLGGTLTTFGSFYFPRQEPGGVGGTGGQGGSGQGGGLFINGGHVSITGGTITGNNAVGGSGGTGGFGGQGGTPISPAAREAWADQEVQDPAAAFICSRAASPSARPSYPPMSGNGGPGGKGGTGGFGIPSFITTAGSGFHRLRRPRRRRRQRRARVRWRYVRVKWKHLADRHRNQTEPIRGR